MRVRTPNALRSVLYVDDDDFGSDLLQHALDETDASLSFYRVRDAEECLAFLQHEGHYRNNFLPLPDLVLLDVNLPGITGLELLATLRRTEAFKNILVAMLTSSIRGEDRTRARELGARAFLTKSADWEGCLETAKAVENLCYSGSVK